MPKLEVYVIDKRTLERILAFARGVISSDSNWDTKVVPLKNYLSDGFSPNLKKGDAIATWGILRGTGMLLREAEKKGIDFYYMDHSYFKSNNKNEDWYRIVKNGHSCTSLKLIGKDRWLNYFHSKNNIMPWKNQIDCGPNILVCPPTHAVSWFQNLNYNWCDHVVSKLKDFLPISKHKFIKVRLKPNEPIVDKFGNLIKLEPNENDITLEEDLKNCCCVIAYNSNVALQASLLGIPVIVSDTSPCKPISYKLDDFKKSEKSLVKLFNKEPTNRLNLFYWLANNQWKLSEIEDGTAWKMLKEN